MLKPIFRFFAILFVRYLQKKYKRISLKSRHEQSSQVISKLILIQSIIYYYKRQFSAWGYYHPDCVWSKKDEQFFRKLFPEKDFKEHPLVIHYNPCAVTYYHNKIYTLSKNKPPVHSEEIEKQLRKWKEWN